MLDILHTSDLIFAVELWTHCHVLLLETFLGSTLRLVSTLLTRTLWFENHPASADSMP